MSRIGKKPIIIPESVKVEINGNKIKVIGPKGELEKEFPDIFDFEFADNLLKISLKKEIKENKKKEAKYRPFWGLWRSLIANMVEGVSQGFKKELEVIGIGWRASIEGGKLVLNVGYSHPVVFEPVEGITFEVNKNIITVSGIDKELVGNIAAKIRKVRKIDPYKGKGIKYIDEQIRRKAGKAGKVGGK